MPYTVALPDGRIVEFPDDVSRDKAAAIIQQQFPALAPKPAPTTMLGQAKEFFKGIPAGAVGLLESAATGASALLPEETEKAAREKIKSVATAAKQPFAATPGYEEAVGRKFGEAVGSTVPFFAAGPLGTAGRVGATALGVGAGAGEARVRAEEGKAEAGGRGTATALGAVVGATEMLPVFKFIEHLGKPLVDGITSQIRRALAAGGAEAAQEAAAQIAQNLIAKGIYKPEQAVIEGTGEAAAYGGATGALIQALTDMALGRRAKAPAPATPPTQEPVGTQGEMFSPAEMGQGRAPRVSQPPAAPTPPEKPAVPEGQMDLGLDYQRDVEQLYLERERLKQGAQTPEVKQRIADLSAQIRSYEEMSVAEQRAQVAADAEQARQDELTRKKFPALANAPDLIAASDEVKARTQGSLFTPEELGGEFAGPQIPAAPVSVEPTEPTPAPPYARTGPYQYKLPLRQASEGQPTATKPTPPTPPTPPKAETPAAPPTPPAKPGAITATEIKQFGTMSKANRRWLIDNVEGKTPDEVRDMVEADPTILTTRKGVAAALREIIANATPKEAPSAPTPKVPATKLPVKPRGSKPSVGVPSEPAGAVPSEPGTGGTATTTTPTTPDNSGLVPTEQPAGEGNAPQGAEPAALTVETAIPALQDLIKNAGTALARKRAATNALAALQDPKLNETAEDRAGNLRLAAQILGRKMAPAAPVKTTIAAQPTAPKPAVPAGMFGALVKPGTPDLTEEEAAPPAPPAPPAPKTTEPSVWEGKGESKIGADLKTTSEDKQSDAAARRAEPPSPTAITPTPPAQETTGAAKPTEAAKPAKPAKPTEAAKPATPPTPKGPRTELETANILNGMNLLDAARWGAANFTDPDFRLIAQRVADTLQILKNVGLQIGSITVTDPDKRIASGAKGVTSYKLDRAGGPSLVRITLNHPNNGKNSGTTDAVILHELIHAATIGATRIGNLQRAKGTRVAKTVSELYAVSNAVFAHVDAKAARGETLSTTEKRLRTNYMRDVDEVLAWALTDRDMQAYMETVPYKGTTAWDKFVTLIRDMLGLTPKADTALSEILRIGGELTSLTDADLAEATKATGRQFSLSPTAESLIAGSGAVDPVEVGALKRMINVIKGTPNVDYATKFRTQVADIAATIEARLTRTFDGAVRTSLGELNPMGLYRQAQDYTKMLLEFFQQGSLVKNPTTGLWEVTRNKEVRAPAEVYKLVENWGRQNGWTREEATQRASRILEAVRLDGLRTANNTQGASFTLHKIDPTSALSIDQQIDTLLAEYRADPALAEMNTLMDESRKALVDHLVDVGRLSPDQGQDWKEVIGYVPFDRLSPDSLEEFSKVKRISGRGLAQVGKLPELEGTTRLAVGNVFNNYIDTMGWMVGQVVKTDATVRTLRSLERVTSARFLGQSKQGRPNTVGMYVKGVMNYWELPSKYDVMAFKDLNPPKSNWLLQLGAFSNVLRKSITALPPFALKQVTDDVQRAIFTSGVKNPGALLRMALTNFPKLAIAELRGIQHPTVREFGAMGLTGEYDFQAGKPASSLLKDIGVLKRGKWETLMHRLDGITRASDLAVRKAIYDQTMKESGNDTLLAQTRAREFINFRRRGASEFVGAMVTTIPFFNAYVQGMDVLYRAASGKDSSASVGRAQARRMFWSRMAIAATLSSLYALGKDDDDEEYKNMDLRARDSNWVLGNGFKIPVPGELGAIFKVIPERIVEYMRRQGTPEEQEAFEAVRTTLAYMFEQYAGRMTPVPQAIKPVMEAWANKSFLTGRPLEGFHQQMMDPSARTTEQTSELARAIANFSRDVLKTEFSPIMIDNALRGYFGSTAALLTAVTDSLLNPTRIDRPLHKWALLSNYMYDPVGTRRTTEFYDERQTMGRANSTLNDLVKTDTDRAVKYAEEHQDDLVFESAINSTLEQLERTRAYRNFLNSPEGAKEMPATEREAEMKEVKKYEAELVKWVREAKTAYEKSKP